MNVSHAPFTTEDRLAIMVSVAMRADAAKLGTQSTAPGTSGHMEPPQTQQQLQRFTLPPLYVLFIAMMRHLRFLSIGLAQKETLWNLFGGT